MTKCAFVWIGWAAAVSAGAAQSAPLEQLLERAGRYARGFQHDFETVIADETWNYRRFETSARIVTPR